jgi:putative tryptophan/tyrosine transport system substrate-binding protein
MMVQMVHQSGGTEVVDAPVLLSLATIGLAILVLIEAGGNLTGFTSFDFSIGTKWLEALKQAAPRVTRVLLVFNPESAPFADLFLRPVEAAAPNLSVVPIRAAVRASADVDRVFDAFARGPNAGLIVLPDISMTNYRRAIIAMAARRRVPAIYPFRYFAVSGGLMSYGTDLAEVSWRAATYVDRISQRRKARRFAGAGPD